MDRVTAEKIIARGELAIRELVSILEVDQIEKACSKEEFNVVKRGIGLSIGRIDLDLLKPVYSQYPDLDPVERTGYESF